jgi:hypothetical protein
MIFLLLFAALWRALVAQSAPIGPTLSLFLTDAWVRDSGHRFGEMVHDAAQTAIGTMDIPTQSFNKGWWVSHYRGSVTCPQGAQWRVANVNPNSVKSWMEVSNSTSLVIAVSVDMDVRVTCNVFVEKKGFWGDWDTKCSPPSDTVTFSLYQPGFLVHLTATFQPANSSLATDAALMAFAPTARNFQRTCHLHGLIGSMVERYIIPQQIRQFAAQFGSQVRQKFAKNAQRVAQFPLAHNVTDDISVIYSLVGFTVNSTAATPSSQRAAEASIVGDFFGRRADGTLLRYPNVSAAGVLAPPSDWFVSAASSAAGNETQLLTAFEFPALATGNILAYLSTELGHNRAEANVTVLEQSTMRVEAWFDPPTLAASGDDRLVVHVGKATTEVYCLNSSTPNVPQFRSVCSNMTTTLTVSFNDTDNPLTAGFVIVVASLDPNFNVTTEPDIPFFSGPLGSQIAHSVADKAPRKANKLLAQHPIRVLPPSIVELVPMPNVSLVASPTRDYVGARGVSRCLCAASATTTAKQAHTNACEVPCDASTPLPTPAPTNSTDESLLALVFSTSDCTMTPESSMQVVLLDSATLSPDSCSPTPMATNWSYVMRASNRWFCPSFECDASVCVLSSSPPLLRTCYGLPDGTSVVLQRSNDSCVGARQSAAVLSAPECVTSAPLNLSSDSLMLSANASSSSSFSLAFFAPATDECVVDAHDRGSIVTVDSIESTIRSCGNCSASCDDNCTESASCVVEPTVGCNETLPFQVVLSPSCSFDVVAFATPSPSAPVGRDAWIGITASVMVVLIVVGSLCCFRQARNIFAEVIGVVWNAVVAVVTFIARLFKRLWEAIRAVLTAIALELKPTKRVIEDEFAVVLVMLTAGAASCIVVWSSWMSFFNSQLDLSQAKLGLQPERDGNVTVNVGPLRDGLTSAAEATMFGSMPLVLVFIACASGALLWHWHKRRTQPGITTYALAVVQVLSWAAHAALVFLVCGVLLVFGVEIRSSLRIESDDSLVTAMHQYLAYLTASVSVTIAYRLQMRAVLIWQLSLVAGAFVASTCVMLRYKTLGDAARRMAAMFAISVAAMTTAAAFLPTVVLQHSNHSPNLPFVMLTWLAGSPCLVAVAFWFGFRVVGNTIVPRLWIFVPCTILLGALFAFVVAVLLMAFMVNETSRDGGIIWFIAMPFMTASVVGVALFVWMTRLLKHPLGYVPVGGGHAAPPVAPAAPAVLARDIVCAVLVSVVLLIGILLMTLLDEPKVVESDPTTTNAAPFIVKSIAFVVCVLAVVVFMSTIGVRRVTEHLESKFNSLRTWKSPLATYCVAGLVLWLVGVAYSYGVERSSKRWTDDRLLQFFNVTLPPAFTVLDDEFARFDRWQRISTAMIHFGGIAALVGSLVAHAKSKRWFAALGGIALLLMFVAFALPSVPYIGSDIVTRFRKWLPDCGDQLNSFVSAVVAGAFGSTQLAFSVMSVVSLDFMVMQAVMRSCNLLMPFADDAQRRLLVTLWRLACFMHLPLTCPLLLITLLVVGDGAVAGLMAVFVVAPLISALLVRDQPSWHNRINYYATVWVSQLGVILSIVVYVAVTHDSFTWARVWALLGGSSAVMHVVDAAREICASNVFVTALVVMVIGL